MLSADPWGFGWEALVAIGTIGLALGTAYLAYETRGLARSTKAEIDSTFRPVLLTPTAGGRIVQVGADGVKVMVDNVGVGPAITAHIETEPTLERRIWRNGISIGSGDGATVEVRPVEGYEFTPTPGDTSWVIAYADLAGATHYTEVGIRVTWEEVAYVAGSRGAFVLWVEPLGTERPESMHSPADWVTAKS